MSRNSSTPSWAFLVASDSVYTVIPGATGTTQDGCSAGPLPVSTSTRHMRHMPTGVILGW